MKQFWMTFFGSVAGVIAGAVLMTVFLVFLIAGMIGSAIQSAETDTAIPPSGEMILELDLRESRLDQAPRSPFVFSRTLPVTDLVLALRRAETDSRVAGVFVRANEYGMAPGQAEEIRAALARVSAAGKFVIAHAQGFEGVNITGYFAVGGADELWLQDTATFSAVGLVTETLFLGGLFEHFGAQPEFVQMHEYKNAADVFTRDSFTEAHREATLSWLGSLFDTATAALAEDRGQDRETFTAAITAGPYLAEQALELGLVDRLGHASAAREAARERAGGSARFVKIDAYHRSAARAGTGGPVIALIGGQGAIVTGDPETGFSGEEQIGGDRMAGAVEAATRNEAVRAIILRVDSPGGSAIASDQIWDAVVRARQAGKPVIVSMGSLAASGGYYIAAPADMIIANASTLTGSIGVLGGKIVIGGALERIGLNLEPLAVGGEYATAFSAATGWSDSQRAAFERVTERIYDDFTRRVAEGRDLPPARVQEIARGRVWTGAQALELGLVDRIGGLHEALEAARELAGIGEDETIVLRAFPAQPTPMEAFRQLFGVSAEGAQAAARLNALLSRPEARALLDAARPGAHGPSLHDPEAGAAARPR